jgi:hypothetical protein
MSCDRRRLSRRPELVSLWLLFLVGAPASAFAFDSPTPPPFDIAPFALPRTPPGEVRFEESRDVVAVEVTLDGPVPESLGLSYLQEHWPNTALELTSDLTQPCQFGWTRVDDWFNGRWRRAKTRIARRDANHTRIEFEPLTAEFPEERQYDVRFRRTLGLRIEGVKPEVIRKFTVETRSAPARSTLRVELDAGTPTPAGSIRFDGYNAHIRAIRALDGCRALGPAILRESG